MLVGDQNIFAIESGVMKSYPRKGSLALGYFLIYVGNMKYGVKEADATMLGCSYGEVQRRLSKRGTHNFELARLEGTELAQLLYSSVYYDIDKPRSSVGCSEQALKQFWDNNITWAPDGDEAFDDGSHVYQFDIGETVRILAFKTCDGTYEIDQKTFRDITLDSYIFYGVLQEWQNSFQESLVTAPTSE